MYTSPFRTSPFIFSRIRPLKLNMPLRISVLPGHKSNAWSRSGKTCSTQFSEQAQSGFTTTRALKFHFNPVGKLQGYLRVVSTFTGSFLCLCGHKAGLDWNVGADTLLLSMLIGTKPSMPAVGTLPDLSPRPIY